MTTKVYIFSLLSFCVNVAQTSHVMVDNFKKKLTQFLQKAICLLKQENISS